MPLPIALSLLDILFIELSILDSAVFKPLLNLSEFAEISTNASPSRMVTTTLLDNF